MRTRSTILLIACVWSVLAPSPRAQAPTPAFRFERPVTTTGGPQRLPVDVPLLVGGRPFTPRAGRDAATGELVATAIGLQDLRLFDASGREVPYLLVRNPPVDAIWRPVSTISPTTPVATEQERSSGFEVDLGEPTTVDQLRVDQMATPLLKRVRLDGSGDRTRWTMLVDEGTLFHFPEVGLQQTALAFRPGLFRYLRLTWDDTRSGRVAQPSAVAVRLSAGTLPPPALTTPVVFERRPSEPGRSRFRLRLPGGRLPVAAIDLDLGPGHVMRDAVVSEGRLSGEEVRPAALGRTTLKRVEVGSLAATALRIPIAQPTEADVDVDVEDGSNPPLDLRGVTAVFAELPWIYFESDGGTLVARYGESTLAAPVYDLEAVRQTLRIETVPGAAWGEPRALVPVESTAGSPWPMTGASVDISRFSQIRDIPAPPASGLVALRLDPAVLAHSAGVAGRFADVRVLDRAARQVPYLVERSAEPQSIALSLASLSEPPDGLGPGRGLRSAYRVRLPFEPLPAPRLVLTTSARVFDRRVSVGVERAPNLQRRDPWVESLATGRWVHASQDVPAPALTLSLPDAVDRDLLVIIEEGDNAALPIGEARLLLPAYRLRFFHDGESALRLAYGRSDLEAPRYDLALLAPQVLGVSATEIVPGPELSARDEPTLRWFSPGVFWGLLALATIALLVLIVRLLRSQPAA
jgi:hypothetical protein